LGSAGAGRRGKPSAPEVPEGDHGLTGPRPVAARDEAAILALNNAHAVELSWLAPERLSGLLRQAFYARCIGDSGAFLMAFDQDAPYDSPNYLWFRERYRRFIYVDRVVVVPAMRKRGLAQMLYEDLFRCAAGAGHDRIVCEVNSDPPNPASDAFHATLGFAEVGHAAIHGGAKTVRYLSRSLVPAF
jgi:predicted GNAT superfamily acetyltransferase